MTQITEGQKDWKTPINNFMTSNEISSTDFTNAGISYLNGATGGSGDEIRFRVTKIGSRTIFELTGYLAVSLKPSQNIGVFKIPVNYATQFISYQGRATPTADAGIWFV